MENELLKNKYYQTLAENSQFRIVIFEVEDNNCYRIIECNNNAVENSNTTKSNLIGKTIDDLFGNTINSQSLSHLKQNIVKCIKARNSILSEERVFIKGVLFIKKNQFLPILNDENKVQQIMIVSYLTNNMENTKDKLVESNAKYDSILNTSFAGVLIHHKGTAIEVNNSFLNMFGFSRAEIIGNSIINKVVTPEQRSEVTENIESNVNLPYEVVGLKKNGEKLHVLFEGSYFTDKNKRIIGVIAVRNISKQKNIEQELIETKNELSKSQRIAQLGSWTVNTGTRIVTQSKEHQMLFKYFPQKKQLHFNEFLLLQIHPEDSHIIQSHLHHAIRTSKNVDYYDHFEYRILDRNNKVRWLSITCFYKSENEIQGITRDITTQKEQLTQISQLKDRIKKNKQQVLELQKLAHVGVFEYQLSNKQFKCSAELLEILEIDNKNFNGDPLVLKDRIYPSDTYLVIYSFKNALIKKSPIKLQHKVLSKNGSPKTVEVKASIKYNSANKPITITGTVMELSKNINKTTGPAKNIKSKQKIEI